MMLVGPTQPCKFTGKERDTESSLDNFEKRYYGSNLGGLMSPDPVFFQAEMLTDPQRFNEYGGWATLKRQLDFDLLFSGVGGWRRD